MKSAAIAAAALVLLAQAPAAPAQKTDDALVREFLNVSGAEKQYDQMIAIMMEGVRGGFNQAFAEALRGKAIDAAKRERAQAIAEGNFGELQREFAAEIRRVMPFDKLVSEVYGPLYQKNFSAAELGDAIAFFKSPSGRKFIGATPQLMQDSARIVNERYMPQLVQSMTRQMELRMKNMTEQLNKL